VLPLLLLGGLELGLRLAGFGYPTGFFEKIRAGDKDYFVNNENFSLRFFPPQLARWPGPVMFEAKKPANTYRIFILGESAARGEPEPNYAASRYLEALLDERFPGTRFEIVNLGITAIDSHVILPIARDCARADGDLWIIYLGNNEMVGPFGAATVFGAKAPPLGLVRLNLALQRTRLGQLLADLSRRVGGKNANTSWGGMKMFLGNQLRADDPRKEAVYQNFERNLNDMVKVGFDSGAKILLNTVAVNLKDCPPFASLTNSSLPIADRAQFNRLFSAGCADEAQTDFAGAAKNFEAAARLDPLFPELQFRWGECLLALTNAAGAREHFQAACDDDALPFRADSRINAAIEKTGRHFAGDRLTFFDAAAALEQDLPAGVCGQETFYEHVHFNFDGNFRLGRAWAGQVEKMLPVAISRNARTNGWASQEACDLRLGLTDWNRCAVTQIIIDRLHHHPLSDQSNNAERLRSLRDEMNRLRQRINTNTVPQATAVYLAAINRSPQDFLLRQNFAEFLVSAGDAKAAVAQLQQVQELLPHSCEPFYQAGRLLSELEQWNPAETALKKAVTLRPRLVEAWFELGGVHLATGQFELALQDYNRARELDPQDATYCAFAGKALSKLNRRAEAVQLYRQAIQMQPDLWEAHFALADELAATGQFSEAGDEYAQVIRLRPASALAHLDRGVMLARVAQYDDALSEFQETLRLEPTNAQARDYLKRVADWKNRQH
ncbi:MAG TPA: tetratricopeptide repeat protein, partial [Candidatus Nitrosopolaris sp.]|nr:tetratricopeptide repeat protein [Candidatus Nitrosopolaris sp.]